MRGEDFEFFRENFAHHTAAGLVISLVGSMLRVDEHIAFDRVEDQVLEDLGAVMLICIHQTVVS